jgi:hypothetical protein
MSAAPESLERLAGMSHLNGVPVEVTATAAGEDAVPAALAGIRSL